MSLKNRHATQSKHWAHWKQAASSWAKWDAWLDKCTAVYDRAMVKTAQISAGQKIIDLGSGTGHPALLIAKTVGPSGSVLGLDSAKEMLSVAGKKAAKMGLRNVKFQKQDINSIPFRPKSFDAATARFSLMFVGNLDRTLTQVHRVLKPGSYFAAAVWAKPQRNPLNMIEVRELVKAPPLDSSAINPYKLSSKNRMIGRMRKAGFSRVRVEEVLAADVYTSANEFVERVKDMAPNVSEVFEKLNDSEKNAAEKLLMRHAEKYRQKSKIRIPRLALLFSGKA